MVDVVAVLGGSDCERLRSGWLAQPANAVSSLAYVVVGLWLLRRCRRSVGQRGALLAGGVAMVGVGVGSVAYHGPQPGWAAGAHDGSVVVLALVLVGQTVRLLLRTRMPRAALAAWRTSAAWMVPALVAYAAGRTGSSLCHPASLWQPHAAWHVLSAVGLGLAVLGCSPRSSGTGPSAVAEGAVQP